MAAAGVDAQNATPSYYAAAARYQRNDTRCRPPPPLRAHGMVTVAASHVGNALLPRRTHNSEFRRRRAARHVVYVVVYMLSDVYA